MEEGHTSLDSLLNNEPTEEVAPAVEAEAAPEPEPESDGQPRGPDGKFLPKQTGVEPEETPDAVPPTDRLPKEEYGALRAVRDENKTLKQQLEALQQQFQSLQQPKEQPVAPPSIWDDEQGWQQHFGGQLVSQAVQASTMQARLAMSEMMMAQQHDDFGDLRDQIFEFVGSNPAINQQVAESQHPWNTAYTAFKNHQRVQELGAVDVASLEAKLREKIMAELQQGSEPVPQPAVPPSLTGERNVGSRTGPAWAGPKPLSELLA